MATPYTTAIANKGFDTMSDPNDVLNLQYKKYKMSLYSASLAKPSEYFKLKADLTDKLKTKLVTDLYLTVYNLLRRGVIMENGTEIPVCGKNEDTTDRVPGYASAEVNKISLQITATFDDFLEDIINILMPQSFLQLADSQLAKKSENIL